ncbi:hypothetical protein JCM8097_008970 [Rhodosporidiobolus ruineniae]
MATKRATRQTLPSPFSFSAASLPPLISVQQQPTPPSSPRSSLASSSPPDSPVSSHAPEQPGAPYTQPPPGALVFRQRVHRPPPPLSFRDRLLLAYEGNFAIVTLERWEAWLVHTLFLALLAVLYLSFSRLFFATPSSPGAGAGGALGSSAAERLAGRMRFYLFGGEAAAAGSRGALAGVKA